MAVPYEAFLLRSSSFEEHGGEVWRGLVYAFLNESIELGFGLQHIQTVFSILEMEKQTLHY